MKSFIFAALVLFPASLLANTVHLLWDQNPATQSIDHYNLYMSTTSGSYSGPPIAGIPASHFDSTGAMFFDATVANTGTFYFVVTAVNTAGLEGGASNEVKVNPIPPTAPTNLRVSQVTAALTIGGSDVGTVTINLK